jgi:hypothetical protein
VNIGKEQDKQKYFEWKIRKYKEWLKHRRDRERDPTETDELLRKLGEDETRARLLDKTIENARKTAERSANAARKFEKEAAAPKTDEKPQDLQIEIDKGTTLQKYKEAQARLKGKLKFGLQRSLKG